MNSRKALRSVGAVMAIQGAIDSLDLDPIKVKLMDENEGLGWTRDQVDEAEKWYKRFLLLNYKYPRMSVVPNKQIDSFWHFHILDTMKYAEDCEKILGYFLHHFPYFGMRGAEDAKNLKSAFAETKKLFELEFGEPLGVLTNLFPNEINSATVCNSEPTCQGQGCSGSRCGSEPSDPDDIRNHSRPILS